MKEALRTAMRARLRSLPQVEAQQGGDRIAERLIATPEWKTSRTVFTFVSMPSEVPTRRIIARAWAEGRRVVVPRLTEQRGVMEAVEFVSYDDLVPATFGLMELPSAPVVEPAEIDLVVAPGLAFDRDGHRLGHGAGYYDRFLPRLRESTPVFAICLAVQLVDEVPTEEHDRRVDVIVTPDEIVRPR